MGIAGGSREERVGLEDLVLQEEGEVKEYSEIEVTEEDWENMSKALAESKQSESWRDYFHLLCRIKILKPESIDESELDWMVGRVDDMLDDFFFNEYGNRGRGESRGAELLALLEAIQTVRPELIQDVDIEARYSDFTDQLNNLNDEGRYRMCIDLCYIYPKLINEHIEKGEGVAKEELSVTINDALVRSRERGNWILFARVAAGFKLCHPQHEDMMDISDSDKSALLLRWEIMRKNERWNEFANLTVPLKILFTSEVKMGNGKIIIAKQEPGYSNESPRRPERIDL